MCKKPPYTCTGQLQDIDPGFWFIPPNTNPGPNYTPWPGNVIPPLQPYLDWPPKPHRLGWVCPRCNIVNNPDNPKCSGETCKPQLDY
jgi:hypothetical protein